MDDPESGSAAQSPASPDELHSPSSPLEEIRHMQVGDGQRMNAFDEQQEDHGVFDPRQDVISRHEGNRFFFSPTRFPCLAFLNRILAKVPKLQVKQLLKIAGPAALANIIGYLLNTVNLAFVGHVGGAELAGAALGNSFMNLTGYAVMIGLCSAVDTLCSQSFGAGQKQLVGLIAQRAIVAFALPIPLIILVWSFTENVFLLTGQEPHLAALAGRYVTYASTTIVPVMCCNVISRFLQAQTITQPQIVIAVIANLIHFVACYLCVFRFDLGLIGAPIALSITWWCNVVMYILYIRFINKSIWRDSCPHPFQFRPLLRGWKQLYSLGVFGMLMLVLEWGSFEMVVISSGWIGPLQLDTLVVILNLEVIAFMVPMSIGIGASTLIGNSLGAGKPREAHMFARAALWVCGVFIVFEFLMIIAVRGHLARIFTNDEEVVQMFVDCTFLLVALLPFDAIQGTQGGVIRGAGYQALGAKVNVGAYWGVGMPVAFLLAFACKVGLPGLLVGLLCAVIFCAVFYTRRINRIDWNEESDIAKKRIEAERQTADAPSVDGEQPEAPEELELADSTSPQSRAPQSASPISSGHDDENPFLSEADNALQRPLASVTVAAAASADADFELDHTEDGLGVEERMHAELGIVAPPPSHPAAPAEPPALHQFVQIAGPGSRSASFDCTEPNPFQESLRQARAPVEP